MRMLPIDKNILIPEPSISGRPEKLSYPWELMEIGDSFFVPHKKSKDICGYTHSNTFKQKKFTYRTWQEDGVQGTRVWRTD